MKLNNILQCFQRRGPIAAEFSNPGPAAIALPGILGSQFTILNSYIYL